MGKKFLPVIFVGTLMVWVLFYYLTPEAPLDLNDLVVVAGAVSVLVLGGNWLLTKIKGRKDHGK